MILINIDSLSTTELQYIAKQEGIADWEKLDREDLIDSLEEAFGEQDDENPQNNRGKINRNRYINSLTSYRGESHSVDGLPGTEALAEDYHETAIHLLLRDPQWGFAYWSFSLPTLEASIGEEGEDIGEFFLRVTQRNLESTESSSYDIAIDATDTQWNINLPDLGAAYLVDLCYRDETGDEISLAQSKEIIVERPSWQTCSEAPIATVEDFYMHFSSLVTREGQLVDNSLLRDVVSQLFEGGV